MATVNATFQQPAVNAAVRVSFIGDPVLMQDEFVVFPNFGTYKVSALVSTASSFLRDYDLTLQSKSTSAPVPAGTLAILQNEGVTHDTMPYSAVRMLNFRERDYRTLLLDGNIIFGAQGHAPAKSIVVRIRNLSGTLSRTVSFPASWIFLGDPGRPTSIAPSRTAVLSVTSFGTSDGDVIAAWSAQA